VVQAQREPEFQRESSLRIQWGGATSQDCAEDNGQGAGSFWRLCRLRGELTSEGVKGFRGSSDFRGSQEAQRESQSIQWEPTFRSIWERGIFQDCQEGVMG
jgi:hypothetical protein